VGSLFDYQAAGLDGISRAWKGGARSVLFVMPTGCHRAGQPILMADGSTRPVEAIEAGDRLMGPDSQSRAVLRLCRGTGQMYEVRPTKGAPFVVNADHILSLVHTETGEIRDVSVKEWLGWNRWNKHLFKLFRVGVDFPARVGALPLDPYLLGVLLGDGGMRANVELTTADPEILREVETRVFRDFGLTPKTSAPHKTSPTYRLSGGPRGGRLDANPIAARLDLLGLWGRSCEDKVVPLPYKTASRSERREILAGLLDTDGSLCHGYDFISKSQQLAEDVAFLSRSLGLAAYVAPCRKRAQTGAEGTYYRVSISGDINQIPCRLPRKQAAPRQQKKNPLRTGFTLEPLGVEPFYGFTLDGDGRYLLGDFTVTHNSGKTRVGVEAMLRAGQRGHRSLWLVHGTSLVAQAARALESEGAPSVGILQAGTPETPEAPVQVASIDTLRGRGWPLDWTPRLVIADEAHHFRAEGYEGVLQLFPRAHLLGLTATPARRDGKPLGDIFQQLVVGPSVKELVEKGRLVPCDVWSPPQPMRALELAAHPVDAYLQRGEGRRAVVYTRSVEEARFLLADFQAEGIPSGLITGETPAEEREDLLRGVAQGGIRVLINVSVLTEGVDCPPLEVCILARSMGSQALFLQAVGRVLRASPHTNKQRALVLDLAGSVLNHGLPDAERVYSLDGVGISLSSSPDREPLAVCRTCGFARSDWPCPRCGFVPVPKAIRVRQKPLQKTTHHATEEHRRRSLETLIKKAIHGRHKPGYVWHAYAKLFGRELSEGEWKEVRRRLAEGTTASAGAS
jgi:superfamily II DNA or RNA helicase